MADKNAVATQPQKTGIASYLANEKVRANIIQVAGQKNSQRFIASVVSAVQANPALQECSNTSILSSALLGEALNLSPSPQLGQYYMVPYKKKDRNGNVISVEAQFQLGAKGYKQLAMRTGQYLDIDCIYIHEGEYLGRDRYTGKPKFEFIEDDEVKENLPIIGYLAYFELINGFKKQLYWSKAKMEKHADTYSQAFSLEAYRRLQKGEIPEKELWKYSSFWYKSFDEMAEKTMIRQLISKWGIMSIEMEDAYTRDMAVIDEQGNPHYVDNSEVTVDEVVAHDIKINANSEEFAEPKQDKQAQPDKPDWMPEG
ncbi:MAG TPA: recombinase [Clostridiales bacterium]|nr:recombinase [Clostridiales bacterium]